MMQFLTRVFASPGKSKRESKRGKRESKRIHTDSTPNQQHRTFKHTTERERNRMFTPYRQGLSVHDVARETGRSSRTVHQPLTRNGTLPLLNRDLAPPDSTHPPQDLGNRHRRRRRRPTDGQKPVIKLATRH